MSNCDGTIQLDSWISDFLLQLELFLLVFRKMGIGSKGYIWNKNYCESVRSTTEERRGQVSEKEIGIIAIKGKTFQKCLIQDYRSGPTHFLILLFHSPMLFSLSNLIIIITTLTSSARALQFLIFFLHTDFTDPRNATTFCSYFSILFYSIFQKFY